MNQQSSLEFSKSLVFALISLGALLILPSPLQAQEGNSGTWDASVRYRLELVDDDRLSEDAEASTARLRLGYRSAESSGFSFRVQGEGVVHVGPDYFNDTRNGETQFPVVADPDGFNLNEAYVQYRNDSHRVTVGRRAINLDNQRFIGSVAWRQNEQTYDSAVWEFTGLDDSTFTYGYIDQVNRIFGPDSGTPTDEFDSESHLLNFNTGLGFGRLSAYAYLLEFDNAAALSTQTYGLRLAGALADNDQYRFGYQLEFAAQSDYQNNPIDYDANYYLAELNAAQGVWSGALGMEVLEGDNGSAGPRGFVTPLATLHKFQGFADLFLVTPGFGVVDQYIKAQYRQDRLGLTLAYHRFESDRGSLDLGTEIDLTASYGLGEWGSLLFKYARFNADEFARDRSIFWFQYAYNF
ncbi:MAG: alginate export family protein [Pseudomonadota bacterium]